MSRIRSRTPALIGSIALALACGEDPSEPGTEGAFSLEVSGARMTTLSGRATFFGDPLAALDLTLSAGSGNLLVLSFPEGTVGSGFITVDENTFEGSGGVPLFLDGDAFMAVSGWVSLNAGSDATVVGSLNMSFKHGGLITDSVAVQGWFTAVREVIIATDSGDR